MKELLELLEKHTSDKGSFMLCYNDHKTFYRTGAEEYKEYDEEDLEGVDLNKNIYQLIWFKDTPIGSYDILGNNLKQILKKVNVIIAENKTQAESTSRRRNESML